LPHYNPCPKILIFSKLSNISESLFTEDTAPFDAASFVVYSATLTQGLVRNGPNLEASSLGLCDHSLP
jgi:hypothetical protein